MASKAHWLLLCAGLVSLSAVAAPESDDWDGHYRLTWTEGPAADAQVPGMVFSIARAPDADYDNLAVEERGEGLARWTLSTEEGEVVELRRFDYKRFEMKAEGGIECLGHDSIFFCRVKPGTITIFGSGKSYQEKIARTGFFGALLHAGAFELTKLDSTP
ncbi:MAG: hypothetical protein LBI31_01175 [Zoogloeaceae bacterium]|nr:hypothetical protein [Zoogloeaceae bacterium]